MLNIDARGPYPEESAFPNRDIYWKCLLFPSSNPQESFRSSCPRVLLLVMGLSIASTGIWPNNPPEAGRHSHHVSTRSDASKLDPIRQTRLFARPAIELAFPGLGVRFPHTRDRIAFWKTSVLRMSERKLPTLQLIICGGIRCGHPF
jgi:hypothetical protein